MKQLTRREFVFMAAAMVFLISYGVFQFCIKPFQENNDSVRIQMKLAQDELSQYRETLKKTVELDKEYTKLVEILGKATDENRETSVMMSHLEAAASTTGIHIVNMQPLRSGGKALFKTFSVEIIFDGGWNNVTSFFHMVQTRPHLLKIETLSLEKYSGQSSLLRGRVILTAFRMN